jgi:transposase-like protein
MMIAPLEMQSMGMVEAGTMPTMETNQTPVAVPEPGVPVDLAALLDDDAVAALARAARVQAADGGLKLLGSDGLLRGITKRIIEAALEAELAERLAAGADAGTANERNGRRGKKIATEVGPMSVIVPRDRAGSFAPGVVRKSARRTSGIDEMVVSLVGKGLTTGEVAAHLREVFGVETSEETVSAVTDRVLDGMAQWRSRPLDPVYPVLIIDAIHVKIRDGAVANRAVYVAIAVDVDGCRDILGLWAGDGGEGGKQWLATLGEIRNRGVNDVCLVLCGGLPGLPEAVGRIWPQAIVQRCLIHLLRNSYQYASKRLYLAILSLDPTGTARQRWSNKWKGALNAFEIAFHGRLHPDRHRSDRVKPDHELSSTNPDVPILQTEQRPPNQTQTLARWPPFAADAVSYGAGRVAREPVSAGRSMVQSRRRWTLSTSRAEPSAMLIETVERAVFTLIAQLRWLGVVTADVRMERLLDRRADQVAVRRSGPSFGHVSGVSLEPGLGSVLLGCVAVS